jgi:dihydrolipoamide dehydrogenase
VASVGLSEKGAKEAGFEVVTGRFPYTALGRAQTFGSAEGFFKIVADAKYGEVLGVHIIGPAASDLIPEGTLAMALEGTLDDIANTIHAHPTLGEGTMETTMMALGLPVHMPPPRRR